ncbi:MAG: GntR family transcriptional regulator [bacterium]
MNRKKCESSSATLAAYKTIKKQIIAGKFKPGAPLIAKDLALLIGTSRTPVREALHILQRDGLVEIIPGKGAFVTRITVEDVIEVYQVREALEGYATFLAALSSDHSEFMELKYIFDRLDTDSNQADFEQYFQASSCLHETIIKKAANNRLLSMIKQFNSLVERIRLLPYKLINISDVSVRQNFLEHKEVLDAIIVRNPEKAELLMRRNLRINRDAIVNNWLTTIGQ